MRAGGCEGGGTGSGDEGRLLPVACKRPSWPPRALPFLPPLPGVVLPLMAGPLAKFDTSRSLGVWLGHELARCKSFEVNFV